MSRLPELRQKIDALDEQMVRLLMERAELVLEVKDAKAQDNIDTYSAARERQILDKVLLLGAHGAFPKSSLEKIFLNIIAATRSLIGETTVAFVGPEGSLTHDAGVQQFGEPVRYVPMSGIAEVFARVEGGDVAYGVVPVETSRGGVISETFDALATSDLRIVAEIGVVRHVGLLSSGTGMTGLERVYSDLESFSLASNWLRLNLPDCTQVIAQNIMSAAKRAANEKNAGAIGPVFLAEKFGLQVIAPSIGEESSSRARLLILGKRSPDGSGKDKTSLLCSVEDKPGALSRVLSPFEKHSITLTKIESKPMPGRVGEHAFFIDLLGHESDSAVQQALSDLKQVCATLKVLGSYPATCK